MAVNQLLAFDAIAAEINVTRRKILFAQYSYKTKLYIINKLNSEAERVEKENEKMSKYIGNMKQRITFSQSNLKSLHSAVLSIECITCDLKVVLIQAQLRKSKLKQSMNVYLKKYSDKWKEDKKVYESTPLVKEKLRLMRDVENKKFQFRRLTLDKMNLADVFKSWINITKKQSQNAIMQFAVHITMWPGRMEELTTRKGCVHQLIIQINSLTEQKIVILAELDEMRINRTLCRINKKQITSKHMKFDSIYLNFDDDLPNLSKFCEGFKSELLLLQIPRTVKQKPEQKYELDKYMSIHSNVLKEKNNYLLLETDKRTVPVASNKIKENSEFDERCPSQLIEQSKHNKKITILEDIMLKSKINILEADAHLSLNQTPKCTRIKEAINFSNDDNDVTVMSSEERKAAIPQTTFTFEGDNIEDSNLILPPTQYRLASDFRCDEQQILKQTDLHDEHIRDKNNGDMQSFKSTDTSQCEETNQCKVTVDQNSLENTSQGNVSYFTQAINENYNDVKSKLFKKFQLQPSPDYNFSNPQCSSWDNNDVHYTTSKFFSSTVADNNGTLVSKSSNQNEDAIGHGQDENISKSNPNSNKHNEIEQFEEVLTGESMGCLRDSNVTDVPMFGAGLPRSLSLNLQLDESQVVSEDSTLDCSSYLETPNSVLLSPKGIDEIFLHNNDTGQLTGSNFLFGAEKTKRGSFKMFGEESSQNESGDAFTFTFNSPEAKKKKNSFFNLFG